MRQHDNLHRLEHHLPTSATSSATRGLDQFKYTFTTLPYGVLPYPEHTERREISLSIRGELQKVVQE